jgi:hypothetical protein
MNTNTSEPYSLKTENAELHGSTYHSIHVYHHCTSQRSFNSVCTAIQVSASGSIVLNLSSYQITGSQVVKTLQVTSTVQETINF